MQFQSWTVCPGIVDEWLFYFEKFGTNSSIALKTFSDMVSSDETCEMNFNIESKITI
jgi:hypothetical protein